MLRELTVRLKGARPWFGHEATGLWHLIENILLRKRRRFNLGPNNELRRTGQSDAEWRSVGSDPCFDLIPVDGRYPSGWVLISTTLHRHSARNALKLHVEAGDGAFDRTSIRIPVTAYGTVLELVRLPRAVRRLRWSPMEAPGELVQRPIFVSEVGPIERLIRMWIRVARALRQQPRASLGLQGVSWGRALCDLTGTYEAVGRLRDWPSSTASPRSVDWSDRLSEDDRNRIREHVGRLPSPPLISVLMPVHNTPEQYLRAAIDSVRLQLYERWELCIADDHSTEPHVRNVLEEYRLRDRRIKVEYRQANGHISAASNTALSMAAGEFVALLDHDDLLSEHALYWVAAEINNHPDAGIFYSDEDKVDEAGNHYDPHLKCDWNPDLFLSQNYISHLGVYRTRLVRHIGGFREGYEGSQDYDLALRCVAALQGRTVRHIPAVLYHWRAVGGSTALSAGEKDYATRNGVKALQDHFRLRGIDGVTVESGRYPTTYRVRHPLPALPPPVSLIIPTRDGYAILKACLSSILERTAYSNYEIIVVDNQSRDERTLGYLDEIQKDRRVRVLRYDRPFNYSAINNFAVGHAETELVGLVNNDIEVISPDWLAEMVSHAIRPGIGAVGAKLYYSDGRLQHGGVIVGLGGVAGHSHKYFPKDAPGYFYRLHLIQNLSAVTAACLVVRKTVFCQEGGLDSTNLPVAFNDVDFCLRLREAGYRNLWTPHAELFHHESATRGHEDTPEKRERFQREVAWMKERWGPALTQDPYYSPLLTLDREDFSIGQDRRVGRPWESAEGPGRPHCAGLVSCEVS